MSQYNHFIDHTLLKATATEEEIINLCYEAIQYKFASVCINTCWVVLAKKLLINSSVKVCTVIGFPLGANDTTIKIAETMHALNKGADEIDMVINIGFVKSGKWEEVGEEIRKIKQICAKKTLKVILETCYLNEDEKEKISIIAIKNGADFLKTSTGFGTAGATVQDVQLLKKIAVDKGVKASGGVRTVQDVAQMIALGANRIGTSNGVAIAKQSSERTTSDY